MASKKKVRKNVTKGVVHVNASFNNTMVTITDVNGETISWDSAGSVGFKAVCGEPREREGRRQGASSWHEGSGSARQGPGSGSRERRHCPLRRWPEGHHHRRLHADSAQRLPSTEEAPRLKRHRLCPSAATGGRDRLRQRSRPSEQAEDSSQRVHRPASGQPEVLPDRY